MIHATLSLALVSALATTVVAQATVEPLTDRRYQYPSQIPYKVDTNDSGRGPQSGYTQCNSTTEGPNSQCQLAFINSLDDFCIWGPPIANSTIADTEAETVAWCSKPGHGTRVIPGGTLTGVQFLKAPAYLLVAGTLNQQNIDIQADDDGGEMDPHGADERGNPLGGLVYTNGFPSNGGNNNTFQQVIEWHNFMGSDVFCFKVCDPSVANSKEYCNNIFDETGCGFVAPAAYQTGVFEYCDSDNMDPVGVYTSNGQVLTYTQPAVVLTLPSIRTPSSSNCVPFSSAALYAAEGTVAGPSTTSASTTSASATSTGSGTQATSTGTKLSSSSKPASASSSPSTTPSAKPSSGFRVEAGMGFGPVVAVAASVLAGLGAVVFAL